MIINRIFGILTFYRPLAVQQQTHVRPAAQAQILLDNGEFHSYNSIPESVSSQRQGKTIQWTTLYENYWVGN